jgi:hypothetical protein
VLTVACVNVENYLGRGAEYVNKLHSMVRRNLKQGFEFYTLTWSSKRGWWAKTDLFEPGRFSGRVLYLDLDCVITGSLDELVETKGIIHLTDWGWKTPMYGSGVMCWDAGEHSEIWSGYNNRTPERFRGDQDWLYSLGGWEALPPPPVLCSYRYHCKTSIPEGCKVVSMHGVPKPHEITTGWVPELWR